MKNSSKITKIKLLLLVLILSLFIASINLANSVFTGLAIYEKANQGNRSVEDYIKGIDSLKSQLSGIGQDVSSCYELNNKMLEKFDSKNLELLSCEKGKENIISSNMVELNKKEKETQEILKAKDDQIEGLNERIEGLESEIQDISGKHESLSANYSLFTSNMGTTVCCKARFDDPLIKYYKVENNKIACSTQGGAELNCSI